MTHLFSQSLAGAVYPTGCRFFKYPAAILLLLLFCALPAARIAAQPPACIAQPTFPANNGSVCAGSVTLSWPAVNGATSYDIFLRHDLLAITPANFIANITGLNYTITVGSSPHTWVVIPRRGASIATGCSSWVFDSRDLVKPTITCPAPVTVANEPGLCGAYVTFGNATATDNCTTSPTITNFGPVSGSFFNVGSTIVTFRATDASSNAASCSFTVTVNDTQAPSISCPAPLTIFNAAGQCGANVTYSNATASDNCTASPTITKFGPASGSFFNIGTSLVVFGATDAANNGASCSLTIVVIDSERPVITSCPPSVTRTVDPGECSSVVTFGNPTAMDNCTASPAVSQLSGLPSGSAFPVGESLVRFQAQDAAGNIKTCYFYVDILEEEAPTITCPTNITQSSTPGQCGATVSFNVAASDNCNVAPTVTQTAGLASGSLFPIGTTTLRFQARDFSTNTATCSFTITITDTQLPTITCPANITQVNTTGQCGRAVTFGSATATDNCTASPTITQTGGLASGANFPVGTNTVTFRAVNAANNSATCSFTVTVNDAQLPSITCPANITQVNTIGQCGRVITFGSATASDNCTASPAITQTGGLASGANFPVGTTTVTFRAADAANNSATCSFTVTVNDTQLPSITCPANITQVNTTGQCDRAITFGSATASDNCTASPTITQTGGLASGANFLVGTHTVTFRAVDAANNSATCSFTVTVNDTQLPSITCPANITQVNTTGQCDRAITFGSATASDNCTASLTITQTGGLASGANFLVGTNTVTFRAVDAANNSATCSFTVTVNDTQLPSITCPANITQVNTTGQCDRAITFGSATASDNCTASPTITQTGGLASGANFLVGTNTVTFRAVDAANNSATCSFTVTVNDTQLPSITCPANITQVNTTGQCDRAITFGSATASDNCTASPTITRTGGLASGANFPVGTTTVTFRAADGSSNSATCSFTVTVNDTEVPLITCPANISQANTTGLCGTIVTFSNATSTDNCTALPTVVNLGAASGSSFAVGTTSVTFRATDAANNSATCSFTVTVNDTEVPSITCPANISQANTTGLCGTIVTFSNATSTDNCTALPTITRLAGPASGSAFPVGTTTVTFRAVDAASNSATCSFTVTVNDTQLPSITCPANISQANTTGQCGAIVTFGSATATDNCTASPTITQTGGLASGANFPVGATTVTFRAVDAANNSATCSFTVTVQDTQLPSITCPANISQANTTGQCGANVTFPNATATDNCTASPTITNLGAASGSFFSVGTTSVIFRATDAANNSATCSFTVTVNDTQVPSITCPANISQATDQCGENVVFSSATATDNCTASPTIQNLGASSGSFFPAGSTSVTFRATDAANNSATCSFTVTVNETQAPTITCPANITQGSSAGQCGANVAFNNATATDDCSASPTILNLGAASGSFFALGSTSVTFRATDAANNSATCSFTVTVNDTQAPTITCPANITQGNSAGECGANVAFDNDTATDNCSASPTILNLGASSGSFFAVGSTSVTFRATDAANNSATCSFTVTVNDTQAPAISCPANITRGSSAGECGANVAFNNASARDNCSASPIITNLGVASGSFFAVGSSTSVTFRATDATGNSSTCSFTVKVVDKTKPTIVCPANQDMPATSSCSVTVGSWAPVSLTDDCSPTPDFVQIPDASTVLSGHNDQQLVKLLALDAAGNKAFCTFTVTLKDVSPPTALCKTANVFLSASGTVVLQTASLASGSSDNCSVSSYSPVSKLYNTTNLGVNDLSITVLDGGNNSATCISKITVLPYGSNQLVSPNDAETGSNALENLTDGTTLDLSLFPNPTSGASTLQFLLAEAQPCHLRLFDLNGRLVMETNFDGYAGENSVVLEMGSLQAGIYMVEVQSAGTWGRKKLVFQK